jgi:hypothetical protein
MTDNEKLPKLNYCGCKSSNTSHCAKVAVYKVKLITKKNDSENGEIALSYRCEEHKNKGTNSKKVIELNPFDQTDVLRKINDFLRSLIGTTIQAKVHTAKELQVKYLKENGAVMCFQPITKKWKYVYYNQIILIPKTN